ncbi:MAG: TetR/AcrR family transcriptional regulator [Desulfobacterales bacterium]|nr:TetR/AcrR family transcriptional regulator [Desulfobacterales bacterium]
MSQKGVPGRTRVERKKEKTRHNIITAAMKLFKKQGYDATTMEQIAEETDIAKGTLYNYFPAKEAIISEYIRRSFSTQNSERLLKLQEIPDTRSRMIIIFSELLKGVQSQKEIFEKYLVYRMQSMVSFHQDEKVKSGFYLLATEIIRLGQKNAEIRDDLSPDILEDLFEFAFIEAVKQFYMEPEKFNDQEVIEQCVDLFINGAKNNKIIGE